MAKLKLLAASGTDTESDFVLKLDGVAIANHTLITRARFIFIETTLALDSSVYPSAWDFTSTAKIVVKLGRGDLIPGHYRGYLVTHDVNHPYGQAWLDTELELTVV